jgi:hypothetical protein
MWAVLRVIVFEWILARLGLRWLVALLVAVPLLLVFFVGIPMLLVLGAVVFVIWRLLRRRYPPEPSQAPDAM